MIVSSRTTKTKRVVKGAEAKTKTKVKAKTRATATARSGVANVQVRITQPRAQEARPVQPQAPIYYPTPQIIQQTPIDYSGRIQSLEDALRAIRSAPPVAPPVAVAPAVAVPVAPIAPPTPASPAVVMGRSIFDRAESMLGSPMTLMRRFEEMGEEALPDFARRF
jgi:hypothetical protein